MCDSRGRRAPILPVLTLAAWICVAFPMAFPALTWAGGTPDPGTGPLVADSGDPDTLPDSENQLMGILGANRGFGFGDYVTDSISGLQSTIGNNARYIFYVEVPPGQTSLTVEIFDADTGAGDISGTEAHDQNNTTGWDTVTEYSLDDPAGGPVSSITLQPQDCDPVTVGNQTACDNSWSDLGIFTVANPEPGHWRFTVFAEDIAFPADEDDNNSFGIRAHDGDASAAGTEYNVYAETYVGIGQVFNPAGTAAGFSRTHDFYPYLTQGCACDVNDWDADDRPATTDDDESISLAPQNPVTGATTSYNFDVLSGGDTWNQSLVENFSTGQDATAFGLWDLRMIAGQFNFLTLWMGHDNADDPDLGGSPGNGAEPDTQPEPNSMRLYLPADGSRFFGERGGGDDAVTSPLKARVGHSLAVISGPDPILAGATSRVRVTVEIANPTPFPIQFDTATSGSRVVTAQVPNNGGQTVYVTGSATINNTGGAAGTAVSESGVGPWDLTFAPGVVDAGDTITVTYDIDVTAISSPLNLTLTGTGANGTRADFFDNTCANGTGGATACSPDAQARATQSFQRLCPLEVPITGTAVAGLTITKTAGTVTDAGNGMFDVTYTVNVANSGTSDLQNVQVVDDLQAAFTGAATFMVTAGPNTTATLTANPGYNGMADDNLLNAAMSTLAVGTNRDITYTVRFDPNGESGPFTNTAAGSAEPPVGMPVNDSDTADVAVVENPGLTVTKSVQGMPTDNGGGSFTVTFQVSLQNTGNVDLHTVQVVDDLTLTFTAPASFTSASIPMATGTLVANGGFTGNGNNDLLNAGAATLPVGATETITFDATFDAGGSVGPFTNTANGSALSPLNAPVNDSDTADVSLAENPGLTLLKELLSTTDNMDGTFTADYRVTLTNSGDVALSNVQVVDDLSMAFSVPASLVSVTTPVASGSLAANGGYDGQTAGDTDLLVAASSTLAISGSETITYSATFDPGGSTGPFTNTADGSGESPVGATVQDSDTADVTVTLGSPVIGVAKQLVAPALENADGTYTAVFLFTVENLGAFDLDTVQVTDDLSATFPAPSALVSVMAPMTTGTLTANAGYDGSADTNLLDSATSTLAIGSLEEITLEVTFDAGGLTSFLNSADASANSSAGTTTDTSDDGVDPDPNGNGNPDEADENDPTPIMVAPSFNIPALDGIGLLLMALLLAAAAVTGLRRQS